MPTSDLKNLLESTQIATVFLDNELRVKSFTPAPTEIFHLVETDIGRPIAHIKARIPARGIAGGRRAACCARWRASSARVDDPVTGRAISCASCPTAASTISSPAWW